MLPCDICGKSGHSWFMCPGLSKKPAGWKPDRLAKAGSIPTPAATPERLIYGGGRKVGKTAFQRIAVATAIPAGQVSDAMIDASKAEDGMMQKSIETPVFGKRAPGRPKSIDDMRAYKAQKQREYRQRKAAEKEAGK